MVTSLMSSQPPAPPSSLSESTHPSGPIFTEEAAAWGIRSDALISIRHQRLVRHVKAVSGDHRRQVAAYCRLYEAGESIHKIACRVRYPPYLLARMLVEELCQVGSRQKVTELMRAPHLIVNLRLRREVTQCIELDEDFSPGADRVARSIGADYERELCLRLRALAVPFEDEDTLRARGLPKTPDVRLLVPLGLVDADGKQHLVNWIDSKAMYGTRETYLTEVLPQVTRYVNRFGPGCIVFWYGFCPSIRELPATHTHHVALLDDFPPREGQLVFLGRGGLGR